MSALLSIPLMLLILMIQSVIISRLPLLSGTADLILLVLISWALHDRVKTAWIWAVVAGLLMSFVSALPAYSPLLGYLAATGMARLLQRRIWQTPILALFTTTIAGSITSNLIALLALIFTGTPLPLREAISLVVLPSTLLNLALSLPVYAVVSDLANWLHPQEVEV